MEFKFTTSHVDVSVALNALKLYKAGQYKEATTCLLDILDIEPRNWDARLMLGACYFKNQQYAAAQRAFRFIYESCPAPDTKAKALEGLQTANSKLTGEVQLPQEFGGYVERNPHAQRISWID